MAPRCIGVDIGGTKVATAVLDGAHLSVPRSAPTVKASAEALLQQLTGEILAAADGDTGALVGIGAPSVIDFASGRARTSVNVPLKDVPLRQELGERTGLPVVVDNDATVAALAEAADDATGEIVVDTLALLTIGTGVGGGVIIDRRIYRGATGAAPELGHMLVAADLSTGAPAASATFPQPGSLEAHASGHVLDALGRERGYADGRATVAAAQAGEAAALEALAILGGRIGVGIANLINIFEPQEVVIGGGVSAAGQILLEPAIAAAWPLVIPGSGTQTTIRLARHTGEAGVRGAALLARLELGDRTGTGTRVDA